VSARPLKILFVHHRRELGGAPTSLSYVIQNLDRTRFEPHVYCPPGPAADVFAQAGAVVHTGPMATFTHIWASVYSGRRWLLFARELAMLGGHLAAFRRLLQHESFDVVHLNDSPLLPAALLARLARIPIVWHLRSSLPEHDTGTRAQFVRTVIRRWSSASIAINDDVAASFGSVTNVIANAVDLERFSPGDADGARMRLGLDPQRPVVAFFGFLYPSKGFRQFIQAAALVRRAEIEATYLIVGGAVRGDAFFRRPLGRLLERLDLARNYEREARELVQGSHLDHSVRFVPFTSETADIYRASDLVVAPSTGPELGRPVLEGAASGVPVVASGSRTGAGVLVPDETGTLLGSPSAEELAGAIESLLRDPDRRERQGRAARAYAEQRFDPRRAADAIEDIYLGLAERPARERVLFVHHRPQLGGAPASLAELIRHLSPRFELHVYCPDGPAAALFAEAGAVVHTGPVSIFAHAWDSPYEGFRWLVLGREIASLPGHVRSLGRLIRDKRFAIVHLNDSPLLPAALVAHRRGCKVVWHLRSALAGDGRDRRARVITRLIDRWGDASIAIDADVAARFPIRLPLTVIHNSVTSSDVASKTDVRRELGLPDDRLLVGYAGFVRRPKGWPELVEAARLLADADLPIHFVILGGGVRRPEYFRTLSGRALAQLGVLTDEESAIKQLVAELGLSDRFTFLEFTPRTARIYRALDVMTFPNQGIGLGRPVLEAAAHGLPVVASGSRDGAGLLVPGETGLLLADPAPEAIASALRLLLSDSELRARMGAAARAHARASFDPDVNAAAVENVYGRVLGLSSPTLAGDVARARAEAPGTTP
jgi:glycosyltransferase involved in cell wall biosynthesis